MDPLTQASLGAAAAAALSRPGRTRLALLVGAAAGAAPDLDVLIKSEVDPLLALQYHRHFTHALLFAPLIGLIVAGLFRIVWRGKGASFRELAVFGMAGALTHGLLDACTSYGTLLYWPFGNHRESWDVISIIDPLFTGPLVALLIFAALRRRPAYGRAALAICLLYLGLGWIQRERAQGFALQLAAERGQVPEDLTARPSLANLFLWRLVYRVGGVYEVDAVWLPPFGQARHYRGGRVAAFERGGAAELDSLSAVQIRDIERFRFFSQGYLYRHPDEPEVLGDLRYAIFPDSVIPLWGIRLQPGQAGHVDLEYFRTIEEGAFQRLGGMIRGAEVGPVP